MKVIGQFQLLLLSFGESLFFVRTQKMRCYDGSCLFFSIPINGAHIDRTMGSIYFFLVLIVVVLEKEKNTDFEMLENKSTLLVLFGCVSFKIGFRGCL